MVEALDNAAVDSVEKRTSSSSTVKSDVEDKSNPETENKLTVYTISGELFRFWYLTLIFNKKYINRGKTWAIR